MAAARHFGQHCKAVSDEFMVCRFEEKDPAKCVDLGRKVTSCAVELYVIPNPMRLCTLPRFLLQAFVSCVQAHAHGS